MIAQDLQEKMRAWRRDFHRHPEQGFLEMRTASRIAAELHALGFELRLGREVMDAAAVMGKPDAARTAAQAEWALQHGAHPDFLQHFREGYTAIVADWPGSEPGAVTAFRFDMDALPIEESASAEHLPQREGFRSTVAGSMHACAHDGHSAIGLGLAHAIAARGSAWKGRLRLIFQPAEEGVRGAKAIAEAGIMDDVDYFTALHLGVGVPAGHFVAGAEGFLASSKVDVVFEGRAAHAGAQPEQGRNALLAAASAALNLHAIARHGEGASRINVGELQAGSGRNIIADRATMKLETRGESSAINDYMRTQMEGILQGAALMYGVHMRWEMVGSAISCAPTPALAQRLARLARSSPHFEAVQETARNAMGSEDATYLMERVQRRGGEASYCVVGSALAAGHHHPRFDFAEESMTAALDVLLRLALDLNA